MEVFKAISEFKITLTGSPAIFLVLHYVTVSILFAVTILKILYQIFK